MALQRISQSRDFTLQSLQFGKRETGCLNNALRDVRRLLLQGAAPLGEGDADLALVGRVPAPSDVTHCFQPLQEGSQRVPATDFGRVRRPSDCP